jgi:type I restriction enzyme S subunit
MTNWQTCSLGELLEIKHGYAFKGEYFSDNGKFILLTPGNFLERGGIKLKGDKEKYYLGAFPEEFLLRRGDLLVAMTDLTQSAPILGSPAFVPDDGRFLHNQRLGKIVNLKQCRISSEFLFYLLSLSSVRDQIKAGATGATVRHTSPSRIYDVEVLLPPLPIQRRIAGILSAYDDLIENSQRRIKILEEMARRLYREWFVHYRFPGHEGCRFVESPLGEIPEEWEVKRLGEVTTKIGSGATPKGGKGAYKTEGIHLIRSLNIYDYSFQFDNLAFIDEDQAAGLDNVRVQQNDVLLNITGASVARCAMVPSYLLPARVNQHVAIIRAAEAKVSPHYLLDAINSDFHKQQLLSYAQGGATREALTRETISGFEIVVPPTLVMSSYAGVASGIHLQRETLTRQVQNLRRTRDLLLPRLLSGQIDVEALPEPGLTEP